MAPSSSESSDLLSRCLIVGVGVLCAIPWASVAPAVGWFQVETGLLLGVALALAGIVRAGPVARRLSRFLIQLSVVMLGLRIDLHEVARAGLSGLAFAAGTIIGTFALGALLARALKVDGKTSTLLSTGTAICGGSAIAAVSGVVRASPAQIGVATGTIFILNAAALLAFPALGQAMHLTPTQFGTWAGVAIHDVSSVVGAAQSYATQTGAPEAVDTATIVKLSRVLWIVPICIVAAAIVTRMDRRAAAGVPAAPRKPLPVPWFIGLFLVAAGARTLFAPTLAPLAAPILLAAKSGMTVALFLIGAGLSWAALKAVGWRALVEGVALWIAISVAALLVVRATVS